jgi:sorbitol-specific phosphotransferase system component IIBC
VKMLLIGGLVGLAIGVGLTVPYFALAEFFAVNARALNAKQKAAENGNESAQDSIAMDKRKVG